MNLRPFYLVLVDGDNVTTAISVLMGESGVGEKVVVVAVGEAGSEAERELRV
ncbi:MAG: hypothetical protein H5U03_03840 [Clostridia bacterium]|nr:hypothetical protein [Clostridia bacterium]